MIIKSSLLGCKTAEVPITLHPDGRKVHAPHLKTFRDGWRTLRFFLLCTPRRLFLVPGVILIVFGIVAYGLALPGVSLRGVGFDAHTLMFGTLAFLCGYQAIFLRFSPRHSQSSRACCPRTTGSNTFLILSTRSRPRDRNLCTVGRSHPTRSGDQPMATSRLRPAELCTRNAPGGAGCDPVRARIPDDSIGISHQFSGSRSSMNDNLMIGKLHDRLVFHRRAEVLAGHIGEMIPASAKVLDVGCGNGSVAKLVLSERPTFRSTESTFSCATIFRFPSCSTTVR